MTAGKAPTIIEAQMGMVDRGADLDWLSQFPGEKEVRSLITKLASMSSAHRMWRYVRRSSFHRSWR